MIKIKKLSRIGKIKWKTALLELYDPLKKRENFYWRGIMNSTFVFIAYENDLLVGGVRILSDKFMTALITDLFVREEFRGKGIGSKLIKESVNFLNEKEIQNIELISDIGLDEFYMRLGFTNSDKNGKYFSYKK